MSKKETNNENDIILNKFSTNETFYQIDKKTNVIYTDNCLVIKKDLNGNLKNIKTGNNGITNFLELRLKTPNVITYLDKATFIKKIYPELLTITNNIKNKIYITQINMLFSNKKNILLITSKELEKYRFSFELNDFIDFLKTNDDVIGFSSIGILDNNTELLMKLDLKTNTNTDIIFCIYDDIYEKSMNLQQQQFTMNINEEDEKDDKKDFGFQLHINIIITNYLNMKKEILLSSKEILDELFKNISFLYPFPDIEKNLCIDLIARNFLNEENIKSFLTNFYAMTYGDTNELYNFIKTRVKKNDNIIDEILDTANKIQDYNQYDSEDKKVQLMIYKKNNHRNLSEEYIINKYTKEI